MYNIKNFYDILGIEEDLIILKNSVYSKIFEIFPDNFILSDIEERYSFIKKYEEFLISLKIDIQFIAINFKLPQKENLKYLSNIKDKKFNMLYKEALLNKDNEVLRNLFNQRFFLIHSVNKKRKHLDYQKDLLEVKSVFSSQEKQLRYMLSQIPLSFKKMNKSEIIKILKFFS